MDPKRLSEFGLTEAESRIYIALLKLGKCKSGALIKATGLQSSTIYNALPSLVQKGLASHVHMGKQKHYSAEPPESMMFFLEEKRSRFSDVLPLLKRMEAEGRQEQKSARVFEGMKGFKSAFNDVYSTMKPKEEYCFFQMAAEQLAQKKVKFFFRKWHLRRSSKGIRAKGLAVEATREPIKYIFKNLPHTQIKYVDEFFPTGMVVYKDKILFLDFSDPPVAFQLKSSTIANSFRLFFEAKWKAAHK